MKGLIIWAQSNCRSTLAFYLELARSFGIPAKINIVYESSLKIREKVGFKKDEFKDSRIYYLEGDKNKAIQELLDHSCWNHLFASYHKADIFKSLIDCAINNNIKYSIMSEAPCNMEAQPVKRVLKHLYINYFLRHKLSRAIRYADFFINFSGYYDNLLRQIGWKEHKIVSFGYFPPPVPNSKLVRRGVEHWNNFTILLSGIHEWHRSPMVLLKALNILKHRGIMPKCHITQNGPLIAEMKEYAKEHQLNNIDFLGFVSIERLINLYETCSVYVGTGSHEPWGMRLNDVLQCGSPIIVSRGMGGVRMVDDYGCGLSFSPNNYVDLANNLEQLISNKTSYLTIANNAFEAASKIAPDKKAKEIVKQIQERFPEHWS